MQPAIGASELVISAMAEQGVAAKTLADQLSVPEPYLLEVIAGVRRCTPELTERIASTLQLPSAQLFDLSLAPSLPHWKHLAIGALPTILDKLLFGAILGLIVFFAQTNYSAHLDRLEHKAQVASTVSSLIATLSKQFSEALVARVRLYNRLSAASDVQPEERTRFEEEIKESNDEILMLHSLFRKLGLTISCSQSLCDSGAAICADSVKDCSWPKIEEVITMDFRNAVNILSDVGDKDMFRRERQRFLAILPDLLFGLQRTLVSTVGKEYENAKQ